MSNFQAAPGRRVLISGSTGLLGQAIATACRAAGFSVVPLVRGIGAAKGAAKGADEVAWEPGAGTLDPRRVSGFDAVIHLAGEPVAGRWTATKKERIFDSRVRGTSDLVRALLAAERPPSVFLCASGINFYGDRGAALTDEATPRGSGFLADVCQAWEAATEPLAEVSRVVNLRIGMVLSGEGGALRTMLPIFRLGLGGPIGGGRGYLSWVGMADLVRAVLYAMHRETLRGPVNVVAPNPVTGRKFTAALAAAVGRPAIIPVPGWLVRLAFGELAEETVLGSVRAVPTRLLEDGFAFREPTIEEALEACGLRH